MLIKMRELAIESMMLVIPVDISYSDAKMLVQEF